MSRFIAVVVALLAGPAFAAPTVIRHVRLIDGSGGPAVADRTVAFDDAGRITAVGPDAATPVPAGATVVDGTGRSLLPALISDHSHVGQTDGTTSGAKNYTPANVTRQLRQYAAYGVTTVNSMGLNGPAFYPLRDAAHAGQIDGAADLFGADRGLGTPGGAPPAKLLPVAADQLDRPATPAEARRDVDAQAARHPDLLKLWLDDFNGSLPVKMTPEVYAAAIDQAHRDGLRVAAHIYTLADAKAVVRAGADIVAHGVRNQPVDDEFVRLLRDRGAWYIPTLALDEATFVYATRPAWMDRPFFLDAVQPTLRDQFNDPAWQRKTLSGVNGQIARTAVAINQKNLKALFDAGVKVGFGTDSGATPVRLPGFAEHRELALMVQAGLAPGQAIAIATRQAAALLKLDDRGTIAVGKRADLLLVDGDPTADIGEVDRIAGVWVAGRKVRG